jgi:hypothetical protein
MLEHPKMAPLRPDQIANYIPDPSKGEIPKDSAPEKYQAAVTRGGTPGGLETRICELGFDSQPLHHVIFRFLRMRMWILHTAFNA